MAKLNILQKSSETYSLSSKGVGEQIFAKYQLKLTQSAISLPLHMLSKPKPLPRHPKALYNHSVRLEVQDPMATLGPHVSSLSRDHGLQLVKEMLLVKYCQAPYPEGMDYPLLRLWVYSLGMAPYPSFPMTLGSILGKALLFPSFPMAANAECTGDCSLLHS